MARVIGSSQRPGTDPPSLCSRMERAWLPRWIQRPSSPRRTKEEWQERSQSMIDELVGHYRLAARLDTSLEPAPARRPPRV